MTEVKEMSIAAIADRNDKRRKSQVKRDLDHALLWGRCLERDLVRLQKEYDELVEEYSDAKAFCDSYW